MKVKKIQISTDSITIFAEPREIEKVGMMTGDLEVTFRPTRRSLDSNAYLWTLLGKLAQKVDTTPTELYRHFLRMTGDYEILPIRNDAVEHFRKAWEGKNSKGHCGWQTEILGESKLEGYTNLKCYYGSSSFDPKEMQRLISEVEEGCQQYGVPILLREERDKLK